MECVSLEKAIEIFLAQVEAIDDVEKISLTESVGRIVAEKYCARFDNPPFDRSPLDGYAVKSSETPGKFKIVGEECAGDFFTGKLNTGEALRIMTGAAIPEGADCVIRQEDVQVDGETVFVPYGLKFHENYCFAGEDVKASAVIVEKNTRLTAAHIGILASQGFSTVKVYRAPKIAVASTGDELLSPDEKLSAGKIFNSNLYLMAARLIELGFAPKILGNLLDDADFIAEKLRNLQADLLITTGGVSVGKKDVMHEVVKKIGRRLFWRVEMKPGAPVLGWTTKNFLGVALSGNPFAAFATFELITRPIIAKLARNEKIFYRRNRAVLADDFPKESHGRRFIRGRHDDGKIYLPAQHASGNLFSAVGCNALVDIPAGSGKLFAGTQVETVLL